MSCFFRPLALAAALTVVFPAHAAKPAKAPAKAPEPTVFEISHNLGPSGEADLQAAVDQFNKETGSAVKLVRLEKGQKPALLNLTRRYDQSDVLTEQKNLVPLFDVLAKGGVKLDTRELSDDLKAGLTDRRGRLVAMPVAYSTPVLFYNKNALRKAGLDAEKPPVTWFEMQGMLDKIQEAGYDCPYTTSWPVWVHIDNVSSVSGVRSVSDKGELTFNGLPQVKHVAMMATWTKAGFFRTYGRRDEASERFRNGECAMITTDSREAVDFRDAKGVELGVAAMPYHDDVYGGRQNTLADGWALWVGSGFARGDYKMAAKFVAFFMTPERQVQMVRTYGQLPLTKSVRTAVAGKLLRDEEKTLQIADASTNASKATPPVLRVANIDPVRVIANEELEAVWSDKKPAKAALDAAVQRGNAVLGAHPQLKKAQPF